MNTLTDGNEFQYMKHMLVKLVGSTDGAIRLPVFVNTPENLAKIRAYLQSLNMTFEQIDAILGDDSDSCICSRNNTTIALGNNQIIEHAP